MITPEVSDQLGLPPYHVDTYNAFSMLNFWCLLEPVIEVAGVRSICEIGSDEGHTSRHILSYCEGREMRCDIVDPSLNEELEIFASDAIHLHKTTSLVYLAASPRSDMFVVDGDHNYTTVRDELEMIARHAGGKTPLVVALHDTSWPCARRDSFYASGVVEARTPHRFNSGLGLETLALNCGRSFPCGNVFAWGEEYGGPERGVLTAVEDSVFADEEAWWCLRIPSFYGLTVFVERAQVSEDGMVRLEEMQRAVALMRPMLAIAEANRLRLLQGLMEHQHHNRLLQARASDPLNRPEFAGGSNS